MHGATGLSIVLDSRLWGKACSERTSESGTKKRVEGERDRAGSPGLPPGLWSRGRARFLRKAPTPAAAGIRETTSKEGSGPPACELLSTMLDSEWRRPVSVTIENSSDGSQPAAATPVS